MTIPLVRSPSTASIAVAPASEYVLDLYIDTGLDPRMVIAGAVISPPSIANVAVTVISLVAFVSVLAAVKTPSLHEVKL